MRYAPCCVARTAQPVARNPQPEQRNSQHESMRKFSPDQLVLALILGAVILGLTIYRFYSIF